VYFADLQLSKRLERAEGHACVQYAEARRRLFPDSGAEWIECSGAYAVFDGPDSPATQTFGLALFEEVTSSSLDLIERFFLDRNAPVHHEVSPFAGVAALQMLAARNYRPIEISNVLCRPVERRTAEEQHTNATHIIAPEEAQLWADISARGWSHEHPELGEFLRDLGAISAARAGSLCFLAEHNGQPGAAGVLCIHDGVALFGGSATIPELRRRGLHAALMHARMSYAFDHGCNLAMIVVHPGSDSQRNAERDGFRIAYTRTKWQLIP
jgi:hypothetical protein